MPERSLPTKSVSVVVSLHGPGVTREDAEEAGRCMTTLLNEVERAMTGEQRLRWKMTIRRRCDGCGQTSSLTDQLPPGWVNLGENDLCPECQRDEANR